MRSDSPRGIQMSSTIRYRHLGRRQFGNAIFTRLPVLQTFRHSLPWPADESVPSMQRMALEAVVATRSGPLRIISTHLEYYSVLQRRAQVEALRALHEEACEHAHAPRAADERPGGSFDIAPRPASAMVCGDFNFKPDDPEHARITAPFATGTPGLVDVWSALHPDQAHPPTVGLYEEGWPLYCCDGPFAFLTLDADLPAHHLHQLPGNVLFSQQSLGWPVLPECLSRGRKSEIFPPFAIGAQK